MKKVFKVSTVLIFLVGLPATQATTFSNKALLKKISLELWYLGPHGSVKAEKERSKKTSQSVHRSSLPQELIRGLQKYYQPESRMF